MIRGTLRMEGYCAAWNAFVQLGLTDDTWKIKQVAQLTYAQLVEAFLPKGEGALQSRLANFLHIEESSAVMQKLIWTGILSDERIPLEEASPAQILQQLLERKWLLKPGDKDMIVMQHQFVYSLNGQQHRLDASLVVIGENEIHTAMAKTVGLPMAIAARRILRGELTRTGVCMPVTADIYNPILAELAEYGVRFTEREY
jgi:saccharopine dehydrogenase-like NADP-dependent oxidoreductase